MKRYAAITAVLGAFFIFFGCSEDSTINNYMGDGDQTGADSSATDFTTTVYKWYGDKTAAISITYDCHWRGIGRDPIIDKPIDDCLDRGLPIDLQMVTASYEGYMYLIDSMHKDWEPRGVSFFGHGHKHDNHDFFDFDYCLDSFSHCYNLMVEWGFNTRTYAYPGWSGWKSTT